MEAEGVAKEVEALFAGIFQRGLGLVDGQPELYHHRLCPSQRLRRATAAEDDEVIGVRDNVSAERFAASGQTPIFQEPVHVNVGEQRACDALNAKDNFCFDRLIKGLRSRFVLDLRRKR